MKKKSLSFNAIFNILYRILNAFFPLISIMYISRILMPSGVGQVAYAQNIASYFIAFATLGIPLYGTREIARVRDNQLITNRLFNELFVINFISTIICIIIYFSLVMIVPLFRENMNLYFACGLTIFLNFINVDWFYQGYEEYVYIAVRNVITKTLALILLFIFVKNSDDYIQYAVISSLAIGGNYIFNIINIRKHVKFEIKQLNLRKHLKPVFFIGISIIAMDLYNKIDITMLKIWCSDSEIGYYNNAQKIVYLGVTLATAISAVFLPRLSYYYVNDQKLFDKLLNTGLKVVLFFTVPCFMGILLISNSLIPLLFGEMFEPAIITTKILSLLIFIRSIGDLLCYQVVITSGQDKKLILPYLLGTGINIILNIYFIPIMNQNGAALASIISEILVNTLLLLTVLKIIKIKINRRYYITIFVSTFCMTFGILMVGEKFSSYFLNICIQVLVGTSIYFIVNILLKNEMFKNVLRKQEESL